MLVNLYSVHKKLDARRVPVTTPSQIFLVKSLDIAQMSASLLSVTEAQLSANLLGSQT